MAIDFAKITRMRADAEARKTLAARMRAAQATGEASRLLEEGANAVDFLHAHVAQLRRDMNEQEREAGREIRSAVAEARWQERQGEDYGGY